MTTWQCTKCNELWTDGGYNPRHQCAGDSYRPAVQLPAPTVGEAIARSLSLPDLPAAWPEPGWRRGG